MRDVVLKRFFRRPALDVASCLTFMERLQREDAKAYELGAADAHQRLRRYGEALFRLPYQNQKEVAFMIVCNIILDNEGAKQPSLLRGVAHRFLNSALVEEFQDLPSTRCSVCFSVGSPLQDIFWGEKCICVACERLLCAGFANAPRRAGGFEFLHLPLSDMAPTFQTLWVLNHHKAYYDITSCSDALPMLTDVRNGVVFVPQDSLVADAIFSDSDDEESDGFDGQADSGEACSEGAMARAPSLGVESLRNLLGDIGGLTTSAPSLADFVAARTAVTNQTAQDLAARVRRAVDSGTLGNVAHRHAPARGDADTLGDVIEAAVAVVQSKADRLGASDVGELVETVKRARRSYDEACDALVTVLEKLQ